MFYLTIKLRLLILICKITNDILEKANIFFTSVPVLWIWIRDGQSQQILLLSKTDKPTITSTHNLFWYTLSLSFVTQQLLSLFKHEQEHAMKASSLVQIITSFPSQTSECDHSEEPLTLGLSSDLLIPDMPTLWLLVQMRWEPLAFSTKICASTNYVQIVHGGRVIFHKYCRHILWVLLGFYSLNDENCILFEFKWAQLNVHVKKYVANLAKQDSNNQT